MTPDIEQNPVVVYVINSFDRGGAEAGLIALVNQGLFHGCRLLIVGLVKGSGGLESLLAQSGHYVRILDPRLRMRLRDLPRLYVRLKRFLISAQPDVVIASLPQANILARLSLPRRRAPLFISFEHNTHLSKRAYEAIYRFTSRRVDWTFGDSKGTLDVAHRRLYRTVPKQCWVVPLLSFPSAHNARSDHHFEAPFHIVNAARFTTIKNQSTLIEALAILMSLGREAKLTLYGEGPERAACERLATCLGISSHACFAGFVEQWTQLPADLFVLVSKHEGLCMVVLEAMNAGIPVAASVVGGMIDYADESVLTRIDSLEPKAIAKTIAAIMDDRAKTIERARRAHAMVQHRFGTENVRRQLGKINEALITVTSQRRTGSTAVLVANHS